MAELATSWVVASDDADRAAAELSRKERLAPGSRSATDGGRFASATPARRRFLALLAHGKWLRESGWGGEDEKKDGVFFKRGRRRAFLEFLECLDRHWSRGVSVDIRR